MSALVFYFIHAYVIENIFTQNFTGNIDNNGIVTNLLSDPVRAKFVKLIPLSWVGFISLRWDVIGCYDGKL